jgi:hypothetical protein
MRRTPEGELHLLVLPPLAPPRVAPGLESSLPLSLVRPIFSV